MTRLSSEGVEARSTYARPRQARAVRTRARILEAATKEPDSYLLGTLERVTVPTTGEGEEAVECPGLAATLTRAREEYAQRYAGLDPGIPSAFQRRKPAPQSNNRRRRR